MQALCAGAAMAAGHAGEVREKVSAISYIYVARVPGRDRGGRGVEEVYAGVVGVGIREQVSCERARLEACNKKSMQKGLKGHGFQPCRKRSRRVGALAPEVR